MCELKGLDLPPEISELLVDCRLLRVLDIAAGKGGYWLSLFKNDVSMAADAVQGVVLKASVFLTSFQNINKPPNNSILSLIGKNSSVGCFNLCSRHLMGVGFFMFSRAAHLQVGS